MKRLLCSFALLWLCYAQPVSAQVLTLDQLISLDEKEQLDVNSFLLQRQWKFAGSFLKQDTTARAYWIYDSPAKQRLAEVEVVEQARNTSVVTYSTTSYPLFEAMRAKVIAYRMELQGSYSGNRLQTVYRGPTRDITFAITHLPKELSYHVSIRQHGLVKISLNLGDGAEPRTGWVTPEQYLNLQSRLEAKQRKAVSSDSITVK